MISILTSDETFFSYLVNIVSSWSEGYKVYPKCITCKNGCDLFIYFYKIKT